jgi:ribonuclease BN (tRNA processing enzyme)
MQVTFLGVGEACDPACQNTSLLVRISEKDKKHYILLDCGFSTPHRFFQLVNDPDQLDVLWISHFHGDHFFGIPLLLLRFWEMGRKKPLVVVGPEAVGEKVEAAMELAYPGFTARLGYGLDYRILVPEQDLFLVGCKWQSAVNEHSQYCQSLKLGCAGKNLFYSGDGRPTLESRRLAQGCDFMIHEAYRVKGETQNHGSVDICLEMALSAGVKNLALVHLAHFERKKYKGYVSEILSNLAGVHGFLPEPGDVFEM